MLAEGYPATQRTINKVGMQRIGFREDDIQLMARIYKLVFRKGLNRKQAIEALESGQLGEHQLVTAAIDFMKASERGLA